MAKLDTSYFPTIKVLLRIFATILVTTATAERTFSLLKRLKTYLRSTMGEERLNGLALANLANYRIEIEKVIELF